jgi:hypothetical protein
LPTKSQFETVPVAVTVTAWAVAGGAGGAGGLAGADDDVTGADETGADEVTGATCGFGSVFVRMNVAGGEVGVVGAAEVTGAGGVVGVVGVVGFTVEAGAVVATGGDWAAGCAALAAELELLLLPWHPVASPRTPARNRPLPRFRIERSTVRVSGAA